MARYQSAYATMGAAAPASRKDFWSWLGKYWFHLFLVFLALHILMRKDISIHINMRSLDEAAQTGYGPEGEGAARALPASLKGAATFSLLEDLTSGKRKAGARKAQVSGFYYFLYPKTAYAEGVPREVLDRELEKSRRLVERFAKVALAEKAKFNLPAGILLAQAILASQNGESPLVAGANNYFAMPVGKDCPAGQCKELEVNGELVRVRAFHSAWENFREHSKLLRSASFESLQKLPHDDYKGWALGLEKLGYSSDPDYARNLIRLIEALDLDQFDRAA